MRGRRNTEHTQTGGLEQAGRRGNQIKRPHLRVVACVATGDTSRVARRVCVGPHDASKGPKPLSESDPTPDKRLRAPDERTASVAVGKRGRAC